jgi:hypothetical protein
VQNPEFTLLGPGFPGGLNIPSRGFGEVIDEAGAGGNPLVGGDAGEEAAAEDEAVSEEASDLIRFLMGLREALQDEEPSAPQNGPVGPDALLDQPPAPLSEDLAGNDQLPDGIDLDALCGLASGTMVDVLDAVFQAGVLPASATDAAIPFPAAGGDGSPDAKSWRGDELPWLGRSGPEVPPADMAPPCQPASDLTGERRTDRPVQERAEEPATGFTSQLAAALLASAFWGASWTRGDAARPQIARAARPRLARLAGARSDPL